MSISTVILRGYKGPVAGLITRGYSLGEATAAAGLAKKRRKRVIYDDARPLSLRDQAEMLAEQIGRADLPPIITRPVVAGIDRTLNISQIVESQAALARQAAASAPMPNRKFREMARHEEEALIMMLMVW